jgi:hypothetical protein
MKKLFVILFLLVANVLSGQTFIDTPYHMIYDSLYTATCDTLDIYFNRGGGAPYWGSYNNGNIDLDLIARTISVDDTTDTLTIDAWAIKCKLLQKKDSSADSTYTYYYIDSIRIGAIHTVPESGDTLRTYCLEQLWGDDVTMADGVRLIFTKSSALDSVDYWSNCRSYHRLIDGKR